RQGPWHGNAERAPMTVTQAAAAPGYGTAAGFEAGASGFEAVEALIRDRGLRFADFWFTDLPGRAWRITMPTTAVDETLFQMGLPLDGQPVGGSWDGV